MKIREVKRRKQIVNDLIRDYIVLPIGMIGIPGLMILHAILH